MDKKIKEGNSENFKSTATRVIINDLEGKYPWVKKYSSDFWEDLIDFALEESQESRTNNNIDPLMNLEIIIRNYILDKIGEIDKKDLTEGIKSKMKVQYTKLLKIIPPLLPILKRQIYDKTYGNNIEGLILESQKKALYNLFLNIKSHHQSKENNPLRNLITSIRKRFPENKEVRELRFDTHTDKYTEKEFWNKIQTTILNISTAEFLDIADNSAQKEFFKHDVTKKLKQMNSGIEILAQGQGYPFYKSTLTPLKFKIKGKKDTYGGIYLHRNEETLDGDSLIDCLIDLETGQHRDIKEISTLGSRYNFLIKKGISVHNKFKDCYYGIAKILSNQKETKVVFHNNKIIREINGYTILPKVMKQIQGYLYLSTEKNGKQSYQLFKPSENGLERVNMYFNKGGRATYIKEIKGIERSDNNTYLNMIISYYRNSKTSYTKEILAKVALKKIDEFEKIKMEQ